MSDSNLQYGPGSVLWNYWTKGKGLAKWFGAEHKWTVLHAALIAAGVPASVADGLTTNIIEHVLPGYMAKKNKREGVRLVTADIEYRSWTPDLEVRAEGDGRTVSGIAVPYNVEQRINADLTEVFVPGAFRAQMRAANRVVFARNHLAHGGQLIGRLTEMRDDAKGLYIEARISDTPVGNETLTLLKDGVLEEMSIGFAERQNRTRPSGVVERRTAHLAEVAVVLEGAYGRGARVAAVRSAGDCCPTCGVAAAPAPRSGLLTARALLADLPALTTR